MTPNFNLTENKIKTYLDEFNQDREKLFSELKMSNEVDKVSEKKIKQLEDKRPIDLQKNIIERKRR